MGGHRTIRGADVAAQLAAFGPPGAAAAFAARVGGDEEFTGADAVEAACPPQRIGLSPGAFAALVAPLFGEFE